MTRSHFIEILKILTKYLYYLGVRLTEFSVTVESVTLRFYCTCNHLGMLKLLIYRISTQLTRARAIFFKLPFGIHSALADFDP